MAGLVFLDRFRRLIAAVVFTASFASAAFAHGITKHADAVVEGADSSTGRLPDGLVKWAFHTQGRVIASPTVTSSTVYFGSTDGYVYAVDAQTGQQHWKFKSDARVASSPAVADGVVYVGSYDGYFYAVDANTGKQRWRFQTQGERRYAGTHLHGYEPAAERMPDPFDVYLSSPTIWKSFVIFGSGDSNIYALDKSTGKLAWSFKTGDVVHASPTIANDTVFIGSWDTYFYAIQAATGKQVWRFKTGVDDVIHNQTGIQGSATVHDGLVYFGCRDSNIYALDLHTGKKRWSVYNDGAWIITTPVVDNNVLYYGTGDTAVLKAVDAITGKPRWSRKFEWYLFASPVIANGVLYTGSWDGRLTAIDVDSTEARWVFQTEGSRRYLSMYTQPDGTMRFRPQPREHFYDELPIALDGIYRMGGLLSAPTVVGGAVYVGSMDGNVYALK